jgi:hypothetical protein
VVCLRDDLTCASERPTADTSVLDFERADLSGLSGEVRMGDEPFGDEAIVGNETEPTRGLESPGVGGPLVEKEAVELVESPLVRTAASGLILGNF